MSGLSRLIAQRLALGIGTLFVVSVLIFAGTQLLPGDVATFLPTSNAFSSAMLICRRPRPRSRSASRWSRPSSRFWPPVSLALRRTVGLVRMKPIGLSAT